MPWVAKTGSDQADSMKLAVIARFLMEEPDRDYRAYETGKMLLRFTIWGKEIMNFHIKTGNGVLKKPKRTEARREYFKARKLILKQRKQALS